MTNEGIMHMMTKARELRETASRITKEASRYETLAKGLKKVGKEEFLVFETVNNVKMPVQMGIYEGIYFRLNDLSIQLTNPAYIIKDKESGKYFIRNDRTEQLFHDIVVDSMIRNIEGKSTLPTVHREQSKNKRECTAGEILQKYGFSIEQYRELYSEKPQISA
jgi:hypothetical protein